MVTTPFTANAFLLEHLKALSSIYQITLCLNRSLYPLLPDFESSGIKIIDVQIERKFSPLSDLRALWALISVFRSEQFSSIHTLTPKAGLLGMTAAYCGGIPYRMHTFTGQVWVNELGFKRWFYKNIDRAIVFFSTRVFCDSPSQLDFLVSQNIVKRNSIAIIGNASISGVDLVRFNPQAYLKFNGVFPGHNVKGLFTFLFVGRITRDKGIFDLIEAFNGVYKRYRHVRLWVVGPDEEGLIAEIGQSFPNLQGVEWIGASTTPEVFMSKADVLILPSFREGFGTVLIEAAACGTSAIAYQIDGVVDAIINGQTGVLVKKGDLIALELAMMQAMLNPGQTKALSECGYERAVEMFCSKRITKNWVDLYESIIPP